MSGRRSVLPFRTLRLAPLVAATGCAPDYDAVALVKQVEGYTWLDVGAVPPGSRSVSMAPVFSRGRAPVDILAVAVDDDAFRVDDLATTLAAASSDDDDDTVTLPITFLPDVEGAFVATLSVWSTDNVTPTRSATPEGTDPAEATVWSTTLRGLGRPVCVRRWPAWLDLGVADPGTEQTGTVYVENCGVSTLVIAGAEGASVRDPFPVHVLPGTTTTLTVVWEVGSDDPFEATLVLVVDDDALAASPVVVVGNTEPEPDLDGDGWSERAGDCDETRADVGPGVDEAVDGRDNDCDGHVDEGTDAVDDDGDGLRELEDDPAQNDCDDVDPWVFPGAAEMCDDVDNDCDGEVDEESCPPPAELEPTRGDAACATAPGSGGIVSAVSLLFLLFRRRTRMYDRRRDVP